MQYSQQSDNQNNNDLKKYTPIFIIVGVILLLVVFWGRITKTIPAGHGGVLFRLFGGGVDTEHQHQDIQSIIEDAIGPEATLVLLIHLAVFSSGTLQVSNGICHFSFPP